MITHDWITGLTHPCTSKHPLYRSIVEHPPAGHSFEEENSGRMAVAVDPSYAKRFPNWFVIAKSGLPSSDRITCVPTYPEYLGPRRQIVFVEDWVTLFSPWLLNGKTAAPFAQQESWRTANVLHQMVERPEFIGVATHMRHTVDDVKKLLHTDKVHYVPIGFPMPTIKRKRTQTTRFLFTNSFGGQMVNFKLRGGVEVLEAFREVRGRGLDVELTVVSSHVSDIPFTTPVRWVKAPITDERMLELHDEADVVLIPGVRVHSMTVARAMAHGCPVVCSDGWGYDEYVQDCCDGFVCKGQDGLTSHRMDVFREYYSAAQTLNEMLLQHLIRYMEILATKRDLLEAASLATRRRAEYLFDLDVRNQALVKLLT